MSLYYEKKLISGVRDVPSMTLAQYNLLTNKPKLWIRTDAPEGDRGINADDIQYDNDTSVKEKIDEVADSSETEKVVGKWIDGKPIYSKTIDCGALPNNTSKWTAHQIHDIKQVIDISGASTRTSDKVSLALPFMNTSGNFVSLSSTADQIVVADNANLSGYDSTYVTMRYTKTTD